MIRMLRRLMVLACLGTAGCAGGMPPCIADGVQGVRGNGMCLVVKTFGPADPAPKPVLVVVLHGDGSDRRPSVYHYRVARAVAEGGPGGTVAVAMIRPGYYDDAGHVSDGSANGRRDNRSPANIDAVADAIRSLKARYDAGRMILIGHSGGAATAGVILGKYPGLADGAVLVSCECSGAVGRGAQAGEVPSGYAAAVPAGAHVVAISGDADTNLSTPPAFVSHYVKDLVARGVDARFILVPGADHNAAFRAPVVVSEAVAMASVP